MSTYLHYIVFFLAMLAAVFSRIELKNQRPKVFYSLVTIALSIFFVSCFVEFQQQRQSDEKDRSIYEKASDILMDIEGLNSSDPDSLRTSLQRIESYAKAIRASIKGQQVGGRSIPVTALHGRTPYDDVLAALNELEQKAANIDSMIGDLYKADDLRNEFEGVKSFLSTLSRDQNKTLVDSLKSQALLLTEKIAPQTLR